MRERAREPLRRRGRVPCAGGGRARGPYALTRWLPPRRSASCARALRAAACSCSCAGRGRWPLRFGTCKTGSGHMFWRAVMWCIYSAAGRGRSPLRPRRGRAARCVMDSPNAMRRAQWRAVAAVVGARSRLRPLVYGAAGAYASRGVVGRVLVTQCGICGASSTLFSTLFWSIGEEAAAASRLLLCTPSRHRHRRNVLELSWLGRARRFVEARAWLAASAPDSMPSRP